MGCFDVAEACKLVGTYILNQLKDTFQDHSVGLYRDDGHAVITIKGNLKMVNFFHVTFNLHKNTSHTQSQITSLAILIHPPTTRGELPKSIGKRLSELSCKYFKKR